jgi:5-(carboxyamino)imidazole ribonucleotide mutase
MGSDSDYPVMKEAEVALGEWGVSYETLVVSAHRTPEDMALYAQTAPRRGLRVIIAGAGGSAHLPGMIAAFGILPVIGVPVPHGPLGGEDALWSIVQMPKGIPVATVAIGGAYNAGILAAQMVTLAGTVDWAEAKKASSQPSQDARDIAIEAWTLYKQKLAAQSRAKKVGPQA